MCREGPRLATPLIPSGAALIMQHGMPVRKAMPKTIALLGTLDSKGAEYAFVKQCIEARGHRTIVVDVGVMEPRILEADVSRRDVARAAGIELEELLRRHDRGEAVAAMARARR